LKEFEKARTFTLGYLTEVFKMAEKLIELFLDQNITKLKWKTRVEWNFSPFFFYFRDFSF
jgi:hypothetical protein